MTELKACPFCGGSAEIEDHRTIFAVRCKCGCCVLGDRAPEPDGSESDEYWESIQATAIFRWNTRAAPAAEADGILEAVALNWLIENGSGTLGVPDGLIDFSDKDTIRQEIESLTGSLYLGATGKFMVRKEGPSNQFKLPEARRTHWQCALPIRQPEQDCDYTKGWNACLDKAKELNQ